MSQFIWKIKQSWHRATGDKTLPENSVLILCNPRSGSTWLFDALRTHPAIQVQASAGFYNYFKLDGRRYPMDLSNDELGKIKVEVLPKTWAYIPHPKISAVELHQPLTTFHIEKIHPEFYNFQTTKFLKRIKSSALHVKPLILVRHPLSAMQSFYQYQQRNPNWYAHLSPEKLVNYTLKTFESIAFFKKEMDGLCLNYANYLANPQAELERVYRYLWAGETYLEHPLLQQDLRQSLDFTRREQRSSAFLGKKVGKGSVVLEDLPFYQLRFAKSVGRCLELFEEIMA